MSVSFDISAEFRDDKGRGASRRLRRTGKLPAVLYGGGQEPRSLALSHHELLHKLEHESFYSHVLKIKVGGEEQQAILKALQRHPAKNAILHADFQRVVAGEKLRMNVPLHFLGEDVAPGVKEGGVISHMVTDVEIECTPENLPEYLDVDVSGLELDDVLHVSDIKVPAGVEVQDDPEQPIVSLSRPRVEVEEEEAEAEAEGEVPGAAPEATPKPDDEAPESD